MPWISLARGDRGLVGSPSANDRRPRIPLVRSTWPGPTVAAPIVTTQPMTRSHPTNPAMVSSLIPFCVDTMTPPGARWRSMRVVVHAVSYDLTETNTASYRFVVADNSPMWNAFGQAVNAPSIVVTVSPSALILSTCAGHASMTVTSLPALAR